MIATILQVIVAIPKLIQMGYSLVRLFQEMKNNARDAALQREIEELKKAKTLDEIRKINEDITKHLP